MPTLLEGEALAVWLELTEEEQSSYSNARTKIKQAMMPMEFISLSEFQCRKLRPGEALSVFIHDMKKQLEQAMPNFDMAARNQLLLHQFLSGMPDSISRQLRASGDMKSLEDTVARARLLMAIDLTDKTVERTATVADEFEVLREQITTLTEQVAALSAPSQRERQPIHCFVCRRTGHVQKDCPIRCPASVGGQRELRRCYKCKRIGHIARQCWQGNDQGASAQGSGRPSNQ